MLKFLRLKFGGRYQLSPTICTCQMKQDAEWAREVKLHRNFVRVAPNRRDK